MESIGTEEFKRISLELLAQFDKFCRENNINYSLSYGTLLGAVRHKGYIPWDDDIDVMLSRKEYNRLISLFPESYNSYYQLDCVECNAKWNRPYAKFSDNRTLIFEESSGQIKDQSIGIDVFPIDNIPDNSILKKLYLLLCRAFGYIYLVKSVHNGNYRSKLHNIILFILKILLVPFSKRIVAKWCSCISQLYKDKNPQWVAYSCEGRYAGQQYPSSIFDEYCDQLFEEHFFQSIKDSDTFLTISYGDYMQLPPEEKRISHHSYKAYWKGESF